MSIDANLLPNSSHRTNVLWMVEIDVDTVTSGLAPWFGGGSYPFGELPYGATETVSVPLLTATTLRYGNRGFLIQDLVGTLVDPYVGGRMIPVSIRRYIPTGDQGLYAAVARYAVGEVTLENGDGALDTLLDVFVIENRPLRIYKAEVYDGSDGRLLPVQFSDFRLVFTGLVANWTIEIDVVRVKINDTLARLEGNLVRDRYPDFTPGSTTANSNYYPYVLGWCRNVVLVREDALLGIFRAHKGPIFGIIVVRDNYVPLESIGDYPSLDALKALKAEGQSTEDTGDADVTFDIPVGSYATCLEDGSVRVGGQPAGILTADIKGEGGYALNPQPFSDGTVFSDGTAWRDGRQSTKQYVETCAGLGLRILQEYATVQISQAVDLPSWQAQDALYPQVAGVFLAATQEYRAIDVLNFLLASVNNCAIPLPDGTVALQDFSVLVLGNEPLDNPTDTLDGGPADNRALDGGSPPSLTYDGGSAVVSPPTIFDGGATTTTPSLTIDDSPTGGGPLTLLDAYDGGTSTTAPANAYDGGTSTTTPTFGIDDNPVATMLVFTGTTMTGGTAAAGGTDPEDGGDAATGSVTTVPPTAIFDVNTIKKGSLQRLPLPYEYPFGVWRGAYAVNNHVHSTAELADIVQGADRIEAQLPYGTVDTADDTLRQLYYDRGPALRQTALKNRDDCLFFINRELSQYGRGRQLFGFTAMGAAFDINLLKVVKVVHPRFGLSGGKNFVVVDINEQDTGRATDLVVWG